MFLLTHIGMAIAAGKAGVWVLNRVQEGANSQTAMDAGTHAAGRSHSRGAYARPIDFRFLLLGSILPDLIDKPLGMVILAELANGRIYAHTLVFALALIIAALVLPPLARPAFFSLFVGDVVHLVLDGMWRDTATLLWPLHGLAFTQGTPMSVGRAISMYVHTFLTNRVVQSTEALGGFLILMMLVSLLFDHRIRRFILAGEF